MSVLSDRVPYTAIVDRPKLRLPDDARIAVWVIVNAEEWRMEGAMPRTVLPPPMGQPLLPDVPNWSWHEYGMRSGFWRQFEALTSRGIPATFAVNGSVCKSYPRVAGAAKEAGWEFMGHGFLQGPMHKVADQRNAIARTIETIAEFTGQAPRGWESPGLTETDETLDLLREHGIDHVANWVFDDLPETIDTAHGPMLALPYTVETNDVVVHAVQQHPAAEFLTRGTDQFDRLYQEGAQAPRCMAISIHPFLTGVPHRIGYLEALLDHIQAHAGVVMITAGEMADWYRGEMKRLAR